MKNPEVKQTVRLIVPDATGRVVICKRKLTAKQRPGQWEFPGGLVESGEDIVTAVVREFREETGISLDEQLVDGRPVYNHYDFDTEVGKWFSRDFLLYGGRLAADQLYKREEADIVTVASVEDALQLFVNIPHQRAASRILPALVA